MLRIEEGLDEAFLIRVRLRVKDVLDDLTKLRNCDRYLIIVGGAL